MRNATFIGRVTRTPKFKDNVAPVSIAVNESYKPKDSDEYVQKSYFVTSWAYGKTGEFAERNLKPGDLVAVEAKVGTKVNGEGHTEGYSFNVNNLNILQRKQSGEGSVDAPPF
jgi:single-stranded DNA-binding protein